MKTTFRLVSYLQHSRRSILLIVVTLLAATSLWAHTAKTYYVAKNGSDSNPGTQAEPWLTISRAAKAARTQCPRRTTTRWG